ncbi:MAG TPA: hypothetical protein VN788_08535, partial [Verrucomicrobiae bacterium]|nr:hypothetical protein [Verrucomicrobiae bacterium]
MLTSAYLPALRRIPASAMNFRAQLLFSVPVIAGHLLLLSFLCISQARAQTIPDISGAIGTTRNDDVSIQALSQEKQGTMYKLKGNVEIHYGVFILRADEVTYDSDTKQSHAIGHLVLEGGPADEH